MLLGYDTQFHADILNSQSISENEEFSSSDNSSIIPNPSETSYIEK